MCGTLFPVYNRPACQFTTFPLTDSILNKQTVPASRFIGSFSKKVENGVDILSGHLCLAH